METRALLETLRRRHLEILIEALCLGLFMVSACAFTVLLFHPESPLAGRLPEGAPRRALMGLAMGATAAALIYSPFGRRSGAHMNPAVTIAFWRLRKVPGPLACLYVAAQFAGGALGVLAARLGLGGALDHPAVAYAVTVPGEWGALAAFAGEVAIAFLLMSVVLRVSNDPRRGRFTGVVASLLVALYITFEAPLSGMSLNPARTLASALHAGQYASIWIYFLAPPLAMLLAAEVYVRRRGLASVRCAKLDHPADVPCPFRCGAGPDPARGAAARPEGTAKSTAKGPSFASLPMTILLASLSLASAVPAAASEPDAPPVFSVESIGFTVSDADRAAEFFSRVLEFERIAETEYAGPEWESLQGVFGLRVRAVTMRLGDETIELSEYLAPEGRPIPPDFRSTDRAFQHIAIVTRDMASAYARLRREKVRHASSGPQRLPDSNPNAGGIEAFYFKDPDGHVLEILSFPEGKGDPKWREKARSAAGTDRLFLGIDHTAIVVSDTERSLRFYRDALGLRVAGASENFGTEQEHLNNVFGARLRITALRAESGPGIEFLEYLAPSDGRPAPPDKRANDLIHWQTRLAARDARSLSRELLAASVPFSSPGLVSLPDRRLGFGAGFLVSDPDGHSLQVVER